MNEAHPHHVYVRDGRAFRFAMPTRLSCVAQWFRERHCRKSGGHWWHVEGCSWTCCQCAAEHHE